MVFCVEVVDNCSSHWKVVGIVVEVWVVVRHLVVVGNFVEGIVVVVEVVGIVDEGNRVVVGY